MLARDAGNTEARREMHALKARFAEHKKKEQKRFAGFFDKLQIAEQPAAAEQPAGEAEQIEATGSKAAASGPAGVDPAGVPGPHCSVHRLDDVVHAGMPGDLDIGEPLGDPVLFEPSVVRLTGPCAAAPRE